MSLQSLLQSPAIPATQLSSPPISPSVPPLSGVAPLWACWELPPRGCGAAMSPPPASGCSAPPRPVAPDPLSLSSSVDHQAFGLARFPRFVGSRWVRPRHTSAADLWVIYSLALHPLALAHFALPQAPPTPSFAPGHPSQSPLPFRGVVAVALSPSPPWVLLPATPPVLAVVWVICHLPLFKAIHWLPPPSPPCIFSVLPPPCHPFSSRASSCIPQPLCAIPSSSPLFPCHHGARTSLLKKTAYDG